MGRSWGSKEERLDLLPTASIGEQHQAFNACEVAPGHVKTTRLPAKQDFRSCRRKMAALSHIPHPWRVFRMPTSDLTKLFPWNSIAVSALLLASCSSHDGGMDNVPVSMVTEQCKQINPALQAKLLAALAKVELGWSRTQVEGVIGRPDFMEPSANKAGDRSTGEVLYYAIQLCGKQPRVGSGDQFVALLFDSNGRLYAVEPEQVSGVKRRAE